MSVTLFNPTKQRFVELYGGKDYTIEPHGTKGCKLRVDDATAKHILNKLTPRGLMQLEYGDEAREEEIAKAGRRQCERFWLRQIES